MHGACVRPCPELVTAPEAYELAWAWALEEVICRLDRWRARVCDALRLIRARVADVVSEERSAHPARNHL
jgi:hypothetical protein